MQCKAYLHLLVVSISTLVVFATACASAHPKSAPDFEPRDTTFVGVPGVVDPTNLKWPREVEGLNGRITIPMKPNRIVTLSVGHDELSYALLPSERIVGVGAVTQNAMYSNVADLASAAKTLSREPEVILSVSPDLMVTSPYLSAELVEALSATGLPVIQTQMDNNPQDRIQNILLLGYIYGEEERARKLAEEVRERLQAVHNVVGDKSAASRPRVMQTSRWSDKSYTAGSNSTEGGIITAAGGINVASEAGLTGNPTISTESILTMNPDVILVTQPADSGQDYIDDLYASKVLSEVSAISNGQIFLLESRYFTTLSQWNVVGVEILATLLWPDEFAVGLPAGFSSP